MKQLFLDSATNLLYVAVAKNGNLIEETIRIGKKDHAKYVVDRIALLLKRSELKIKEIKEIYVGVGPGSYTGLRVSVTVAKMLAYALGINLYQVSSLYFLASGYNYPHAPMIDARNGNVFAAIYDEDKTLREDSFLTTDALKELAKKEAVKPLMLDEYHYQIDLKNIIKKATLVVDVDLLEPNYLRKTKIS